VHALPSLHGAVLFGCEHDPLAGLQVSSVQTLPSPQLFAFPVQDPPEHLSFVVQAFPSLQLEVLFVNLHPVFGLQESVVQGLPSLHVSAPPPLQHPPEHLSFVVHALPSSHGAALFVCLHLPR
jgi:hypothetical protein